MAMNGRDLRIKKDSTTLAAVSAKTIKIGNTAVDVTSDDNNGFRTLLSKAGMKSIDMDVSGLADSAFASTLRTIALTGTDLQDTYTIEWLDATGTVVCKVTGSFNLSDYEEKGEKDGEVAFSGKLASSGTYTYAAGP